ncbi:MAG: PH domain-containing protein [Anaerolineaceae bacterium]|nr:PH domain-containing protein [Anaerolineaceae bacterium]
MILNIVIALLLIGAILFLLISGSMTDQNILAIVLTSSGLVLLLPLALAVYRIFTISTTVYKLGRDALEITWGLRRELLPMGELEWVHPVSDFETPLPLPFSRIRGSYYGETTIKGLGKTIFAATEPGQMVLIKRENDYLVISPENAAKFSQAYQQLTQLGSLTSVEAESENLRMLWQRVMTDAWAKALLFAGFFSSAILILTSVVIVAVRPQIIWVTLEVVPSARLFLLGLIGLFFGIFNTLYGLLLYLQERMDRKLVYLLWAWSIFINSILLFAMISMSF